MALAVTLLAAGVLARAAAPEPQEPPAAPELVPVTKELWEDERTHKIRFAIVVPPTEGVSEKAIVAVELFSRTRSQRARDLFGKSSREELLFQKQVIEYRLKVEEAPLGPAPEDLRRPPWGEGPMFEEAFSKALNESDLVEAVERQSPGGRKTTVYLPKKGRERDVLKLRFEVAHRHLANPKHILDRENTIEAEVKAATEIFEGTHRGVHGRACVVESYLKDKEYDFVSGLGHFLASRGVTDWQVRREANPGFKKIVAFVKDDHPVVLHIKVPLQGRSYVTAVGFVAADQSLILSMPSSDLPDLDRHEFAPTGCNRVAWKDLAGRIEAAFVVVQAENPKSSGDTHNRALSRSWSQGFRVFSLNTVVCLDDRFACLAHTHAHRARDAASDRA